MSDEYSVPRQICIRLNRICSLGCSFCLACHSPSEGLPLVQFLYAMDELQEHGMKSARLAGGEPTLRPDLMEIVDYFYKKGLRTTIYSNLYKNEDVLDRLIQYPLSFTTSIHGNEVFHDSVTKKGAYRSTMNNVCKLTSRGIDVNLHFVVMRNNIQFAEDVIAHAANAGVKKITFQTLIPRERGRDLFSSEKDSDDIQQNLCSLYPLQEKYKDVVKIKFIDLYRKFYYVFETDGCLYLQKESLDKDILIRRII